MQALLNEILEQVRPLIGQGKVADYIPALADVPANQLGIAYSSLFKGVGVFAAGPYMCAGLNNYTQTVTVNGQQVTRVRIGPFTSRKQMEQVAAKVRALGLPVSMYQL